MLSDWRFRLRALFRRRRVEQELDQELRFHLERQTEALVRTGLPAHEARRQARLELGGVDQIKEDCRDARGVRLIHELGRDARYAWRVLIRRPTASFVVIATLGLGMGANTAIFSLIDALLLRKLPVAEPDRLITIEAGNAVRTPWTYPIWENLARRDGLFESAAAWCPQRFNIAPGSEPEYADGLWVSGDFFRTLGVGAAIGRTLTADDDRIGGGPDGPVAVISYGFWHRRFAGASDVVGRTLIVEHAPLTVVGVTPPAFFGLEVGSTVDVMVPLGAETVIRPGRNYLANHEAWWLFLTARLRRDQTADSLTRLLTGIQPQVIAATVPPSAGPEGYKEYLTNFQDTLVARPAATGTSGVRDRYTRPLVALMVVVAIVLLSACTNVASLLVARASARRHELTVRAALGASRWQLARQLLVESLLLAGAGAAAGLLVGRWGSRFLVQQVSPPGRPIAIDLSLNARVLIAAATVACVTTLFFGTAPALRATKVEPAEAFADGARTIVGRGRLRASQSLVIAQVALSLVLVVAAALFGRTLYGLVTTPLGFEPDRILVTTLQPPTRLDAGAASAFADQIREAAGSVPGVANVATSFLTPVSGLISRNEFNQADAPGARPAQRAYVNKISSGWFETYRTPLVAGRDFTPAEDRTGASVAIINEAFAQLVFGDGNPIGRRIVRRVADTPQPAWEIVGVVRDAVYRSLREGAQPTVYVPFGTLPSSEVTLSVRSATDSPARLAPAIARALKAVQPDLKIDSRPLMDTIGRSLTQERLLAGLSGFFGMLALALAGIGLYGTTAQMISRRRTELGLRLALGATPGSLVMLTLSHAGRLVGAGLVLGGVASLWVSRFAATLLFGVTPHDATTLATSAAVLGLAAGAAAWLPARRVARIDAVEVLRGA